jgi:hypothetical protein
VNWFWNLFDARRKIPTWKTEYNSRRPHSSLGYLSPDEFAQQWNAASLSGKESMAGDPANFRQKYGSGAIQEDCWIFANAVRSAGGTASG